MPCLVFSDTASQEEIKAAVSAYDHTDVEEFQMFTYDSNKKIIPE